MTLSPDAAINAQIDSFPALPATVTKVLAVTADPESTANDLMQAILPDQTMCAAILKVANSAFFGIPKEVNTIERAVVVLGYSEIQNIVVSKAIFGSFPKLNKDSREDVGRFWDHSFTCGLAAKIIAKHFNLNAGEYFVAGLLHDIGKLVLFLTFTDTYQLVKDIETPESFNDLEAEQEKYGFDHADVGFKLTQRWMLPDQLSAVAGYHHAPQKTTDHTRHTLIVQLADLMAMLHRNSPNPPSPEFASLIDRYLPGTSTLWSESKIEYTEENLHLWYEQLVEKRKSDQAILNILSS